MRSGSSIRTLSELRAWHAAVAIAIGLALASCDKVPLVAPTNSTITLTAGTRTLATGGSTTLSAFVTESNGSGVQNGTTVRFTTTLGRVDPAEAQTTNGVATTTFFAGDLSGVAQVSATSGNAGVGTTTGTTPGTTTGGTTTTTPTSSNVVDITVGAAAVKTVTVSASPTSVPSTGGTVTITASAIDSNGNRLPGVQISFSTDVGSLSALSAVTDANGNASVQLTTSQAATVTANAGGATAATVKITVNTPATVSLSTPSPSPAVVGQPVSITVTPATNTSPRVVVDWGDGNKDDLGVVAAARGAAHTYSKAGGYIITATATNGSETFSTSTTVTVNGRTGVSLSVTPTSGPAATTSFSFTVTPSSGTAIQDVKLDFGDGQTRDLGGITSATTVTHSYSTTGTKTVTATETDSDGTVTTATVTVTVS